LWVLLVGLLGYVIYGAIAAPQVPVRAAKRAAPQVNEYVSNVDAELAFAEFVSGRAAGDVVRAELSDKAVMKLDPKIGPVSVPAEFAADYEMLASTTLFATGRIGRGGAVPEEVTAWIRIADSPAAKEVFERVLLDGAIEGQLYALCGLSEIDPELAEKYRRGLGWADLSVNLMTGCIRYSSLAQEVVAKLDLAEAVREMRAVIADEVSRTAAGGANAPQRAESTTPLSPPP
jgi:hypothetical protein